MDDKLALVPNPILFQKTKKVTEFGPALDATIQTMVDTMRAHDGIGLAAPQIGSDQRIIVVEYKPDERSDKPIPLTVLINPTITDSSSTTDWMNEGCLSIPGVEVPVKRPTQVSVLAQDQTGKRIKIRAKDLYARILQHEIDHTNGILISQRAYPELTKLAGLKILFMGTPSHVLPYITALAATPAQLLGVITETDKPAGRNQQLMAPPVKIFAQKLNLPVWQFADLKGKAARALFDELKPDLVIVAAYGQIIPKSLLPIPKHGFLNVHYSLLPALRGPSPHQTAIQQGLRKTGATIFQLDATMDTGPILMQKSLDIDPQETSLSLIERLVPLSIEALFETLPDYIAGKRQLKPQNHHQATYTQLLTKEDGRIDWDRPIEEIDRQIRTCQPWPLAFTEVDNQRLIIHAAHIEKDQLVIDIVQPAGKQAMAFKDYLRSNQQNRLTFFQKVGKVRLT